MIQMCMNFLSLFTGTLKKHNLFHSIKFLLLAIKLQNPDAKKFSGS